MHEVLECNQNVPATKAPVLDIFRAQLRLLSDGSAIPLVVGEQAVPPGYGVPNHVHADDDERFYVIEGELAP
jgi:hypothetical protein